MATVFKSTTLISATDDVTVANKAFFTSILGDMAGGFYQTTSDANPFAKFDGTRQGLALGAGGAGALDTHLDREAAGILAVRNAADNAYGIIRGATPVGANDLATKSYADGLIFDGDLIGDNYRVYGAGEVPDTDDPRILLSTDQAAYMLPRTADASLVSNLYGFFSRSNLSVSGQFAGVVSRSEGFIFRNAADAPATLSALGFNFDPDGDGVPFLLWDGASGIDVGLGNNGSLTLKGTGASNGQLWIETTNSAATQVHHTKSSPIATDTAYGVQWSATPTTHNASSFRAYVGGYWGGTGTETFQISALGSWAAAVLSAEPGSAPTGMVRLYIYDNAGTLELKTIQSDGTKDVIGTLT